MVIENLMRKSASIFSTAILALSLAGCETTASSSPSSLIRDVSIDTDAVSGADFSSYKTYYVLDVPPGENDVAPPKPFSRTVVEAAVRKQMDARNYREITDKDAADMMVAIQFSLKDEQTLKKRTTYDTGIVGYSGYGLGYGTGYGRGYGRSSYGGGYGRSSYGSRYSGYSYGYGYRNYYGYAAIPRSTVVVEEFRQGNMLIDLIDRKSNAVVWEAHASGEGEHKPEKIEAKVNAVVSSIFDRYPHQAAATEAP